MSEDENNLKEGSVIAEGQKAVSSAVDTVGKNAEFEVPQEDLLLIRRILGLSLRSKSLAEEYDVKDKGIDVPGAGGGTEMSKYAKLQFKKEGEIFVPDILPLGSLHESISGDYPDYDYDLDFRTRTKEDEIAEGWFALSKRHTAPKSSPNFPRIFDYPLGSLLINGYAIPWSDQDSVYARLNTRFDTGDPRNPGFLSFGYNNGPFTKLKKTLSLGSEPSYPTDSSDYYQAANGLLDLAESVIGATESILRK
ncbi:MAG TPA: hypothetical protein VG935_03930 [Patescibacteria group bacterium]|nr:hypothetical protein [Patescibacteria group bacterium]